MKTLCAIALVIATTTVALAQHQMPRTVKLFNNRDGAPIGTATEMWPGAWALRDAKGVLLGSFTVEPDGTRVFRDPSGKEIDTLSIAIPKID
jgi:hypothetical protein